jgi:hypothetical protein
MLRYSMLKASSSVACYYFGVWREKTKFHENGKFGVFGATIEEIGTWTRGKGDSVRFEMRESKIKST